MCPKVDQEAASKDIRVEFASGAILAVSIDGSEGLAIANGGEVVASTDNLYCWATSTNVCRITLKRLRLRFRTIEFKTTAGNSIELQGLTFSIATPLALENSGWGYEIPLHTKVLASLSVDGQGDCGEAVTAEPARIDLDPILQIASFDGALPLTFHLPDNCQRLSGQVSGMISGVSPWAQFPTI